MTHDYRRGLAAATVYRTVVPVVAAVATFAALACSRRIPTDSALPAPAPGDAPAASSPTATPTSTSTASASSSPAPSPASPFASSSSLPRPVDGPHELPLGPGRSVFYALPGGDPTRPGPRPWRLVAHLHGICHPPSYSCGKWTGAAVDAGVLVCPTGNARCGDASIGPPSWEAASWEELVASMDADLERSVAKVEAKHRGSVRREGAVLTGWSRGGFAAPVIARMHPGRWPYLVIIEANVALDAGALRKAGVRAVALLAGELGTEIAGERRTQAELERAGFPARLFVMRKVAHLYPDDMERLMGEALDFVLSHEPDAG